MDRSPTGWSCRRCTWMRGTLRVALLIVSSVLAWSPSARAQVPPASPVEGAPPPPAPDPSVASPLPAPPAAVELAPAPAPAPVTVATADPSSADPSRVAASDLDPEVRPWALGYSGLSQVPVGIGAAVTDLTIPAIGLRYWVGPKMAVDVALGLGWTGGSYEAAGSTLDKNPIWGFILQGGLPFALSTHRHVSFQVIPFAAVAHGGTSIGTGTAKSDASGTRVDIGARAGLEVFFGFIGVPELALSATVGLQFEMRKYSLEMAGMSRSDTTLGISTTVQNSPWDIFTGNVAARYYF